MTTIVVVQKDGVAAIGADTMTKLGATFESARYIENHSKINQWGDNYFAHTGHASFGLVLASYFAGIEKAEELTCAQDVFEFARPMHRALKEDYFLNPTEDVDDPFESLQVQCLIANPSGIFGLYALRSVQQYTRFYAFGSGYKFALGAMCAVYESDYSAQDIARIGVESAAEFDDGTGLPFEIQTVKLKG